MTQRRTHLKADSPSFEKDPRADDRTASAHSPAGPGASRLAFGPWAVGWRGGFGAGVLVRDWVWTSADAPSWPLGGLLGARKGPGPLCAPADVAGDMGPGLVLGSTAAVSSRCEVPPRCLRCSFPVRIGDVIGTIWLRRVMFSPGLCSPRFRQLDGRVEERRRRNQRAGTLAAPRRQKCRCLWVRDTRCLNGRVES